VPFNPSKVNNYIKPPISTIYKSIIIQGSTSIELTTPFKQSVLIISPIYNEDTCSTNAALLTELTTCDTLSTPARTYRHCIVRREEHSAVSNIIREEEHEKLKAAVTKRKVFQRGKRQIVDGQHILTTLEVHAPLLEWEKNVKKRKTSRTKKSKRRINKDKHESMDISKAI